MFSRQILSQPLNTLNPDICRLAPNTPLIPSHEDFPVSFLYLVKGIFVFNLNILTLGSGRARRVFTDRDFKKWFPFRSTRKSIFEISLSLTHFYLKNREGNLERSLVGVSWLYVSL